MTTQEEAEYIHKLLPYMAKEPYGYDISEYSSSEEYEDGVYSISDRLQAEKLAVANDPKHTFYLAITPKGKQIAERPDGYLGYLQQEEKRLRTEESRAKKNVMGTFGSFIVAGLALAFALYTYFATSQDTGALEKKVQTLEQRLQSLEQQRQRHDAQPHQNGAH